MGRGKKVDKMLERKERDFNFPNASKPCHDRAEFCFEKMSEKLQDVGKEPDKGVKKPQRKGATPTSAMALKPFNSCAGNFFSTNPAAYQARIKGMWLITDRSGVHPNCKNASNPYHKCAEYCLKNIPNKDIPVMKLKSPEGNIRGRTSLQPQCIYANPQHECTEICFQNLPDSNTREGENSIDASTNADNSSPFRNHIRASIPDRKDVECCFENTPEEKHPHKALNLNEEIKTLVAAVNEVKCECKNAPPSQLDDEYCFQNLCEDRDLQAVKKAKEETEVVSILQREMNSSCEKLSDSYIDYCFKNVPEDQPRLDVTKFKEEDKITLPGEIWVNSECQFASNLYHECAEYCFQSAHERERRGHAKKIISLWRTVSNREPSLHSRCQFASNPYHDCAADCFQNELDQNKAEEESEDGKKETSVALEINVNTKCKLASNSFHKCSEYYPEEQPDKNQPVECIPVITKEKRNLPSEKIDHLVMENCSVNLEFVEASKPIYNNVESTVDIILEDRIEKSSKDSKFVETSNPDSDNTEFCKEITMQVVTTDLMPEVETKITKEPSDVQPLQLDASDLFLEWAKYCSQEGAAGYKIVMQVEMRASETKNDQENDDLKYYDSSSIEKVKAEGSLQRSLPTSLLYFLGFLFALFKWTQMIHTLVMSSERKKSSGRVTHKRHIGSK